MKHFLKFLSFKKMSQFIKKLKISNMRYYVSN